jgi:Omp85 superfamily domain
MLELAEKEVTDAGRVLESMCQPATGMKQWRSNRTLSRKRHRQRFFSTVTAFVQNVSRSFLLGIVGAAIVWTVSGPAWADDGRAARDSGLDPRRYELAGFPIVGGNSDIGVQFGAATTLTKFYDDALPYFWNVDLLLSGSIKDDQNGLRLVQQSHVLRLDAPDLLSGRLRVDSRASFQRTINAGYFGLGNATTADPLPGSASLGRRYQYLQEETRLRTIARIHTASPVDLALGAIVRFESPEDYASSRLADDLSRSGPSSGAANYDRVYGSDSAFLAGVAAGMMIDTRDSEFVTRSGIFYQIGAGVTVGTADRIAYGNMSAVLSHYAPLGGPFIFASRFVASFQFGHVPFYDLAQGGTFEPQNLLGSESGVRGVPEGRYAGAVKMIANTELRCTPFPRFQVLGQRLRIGTTAFFDAGRVWSGYAVVSPADGSSLGLKYGVGGGAFLQWGEAAIFRVEVAYSPDAESANPGFPLGIYVADGLMF